MLSLTKQDLIKHMVIYSSKQITMESNMPELLLYAKYHVGDKWLCGEVYGKVTDVKHFKNYQGKRSQVTFDFSDYELELVQRKVDKQV